MTGIKERKHPLLPVNNPVKILYCTAKKGSDSLVAQADSQDGFRPVKEFQQTEHGRILIWNSRTGREQNLVEKPDLLKNQLFGPYNIKGNFAMISQQPGEVISERVIVVEQQYFFHGMELLNRQESEDKITQYALEGRPFLFAINFQGTGAFILTPEEASENNIFFNINGITNYPFSKENLRHFSFTSRPVSLAVYQEAFEKVIAALNHGDTYLLNLTFPTKLETDLSPEEIFRYSQTKYKMMADGEFVVFSPETFIRIHQNRIFSFPMKGTISATIPDAAEIILADRKELYEHNTIVDLIRNDLGMVSANVKVVRFRYVERIKSLEGDLLQVSSEISGELPDDYLSHLGTILFTLLWGIFLPGSIIALATAFFFGLCSSSFLPVLILGLYWRGITRAGAVSSMVGGFLISTLYAIFIHQKEATALGLSNWLFGSATLVAGYPAGSWMWKLQFVDQNVIAMPCALLIAVIVSFVTPKMDKAYVDRCFKNL